MEAKEQVKAIFEVGKKYTLYSIGGLAMTSAQEITVKGITEDNIVFAHKGKRKRYGIRLNNPSELAELAVFRGWDTSVKSDSQVGGIVRGNACLNFVGSVESIKAMFEEQINPIFNVHHRILAVSSRDDDQEQMVFPERYRGGHAVIDRILARIS